MGKTKNSISGKNCLNYLLAAVLAVYPLRHKTSCPFVKTPVKRHKQSDRAKVAQQMIIRISVTDKRRKTSRREKNLPNHEILRIFFRR